MFSEYDTGEIISTPIKDESGNITGYESYRILLDPTENPSSAVPATSSSTSLAGFDFGANWPILGIIGFGLLVSMRGKGKPKQKRRYKRR